jgi:hypothetical protein
MKYFPMGAIAALALTLAACSKDDSEMVQPLTVQTVRNLAADTTIGFSPTGRPIGANRYTYFSLRENKIIEGADTLTNKWDIAFKQFIIKVNGGTNATGGGNAAVLIANNTFEGYTQITEADADFKQDNGPAFAINPAPGGWYTYSTTTFLAFPIPGKIFVIRTADGRFAKMEITSFYKNGLAPDVSASPAVKALAQFFYQFRYTFQPNGSKTF